MHVLRHHRKGDEVQPLGAQVAKQAQLPAIPVHADADHQSCAAFPLAAPHRPLPGTTLLRGSPFALSVSSAISRSARTIPRSMIAVKLTSYGPILLTRSNRSRISSLSRRLIVLVLLRSLISALPVRHSTSALRLHLHPHELRLDLRR